MVFKMLQDNYLGTEPQFICGVCSQAVTNPICPFCLAEEVEAWLTYYPNLNKLLKPKIKKYLDKIEDNVFDMTECIKCKRNLTGICPYCFTNYVLKELKNLKASELIIGEFIEFFNYDEDHDGYYKEGEKLGIF